MMLIEANEPPVVYAEPNAEGGFAPEQCEILRALPASLGAEILVVRRDFGWQSGAVARLQDATYDVPPIACSGSALSREAAIVATCENLVYWCSQQKDQGSKKHRRQVEQLQEWALSVEKQHATAALAADTGTDDDGLSDAAVDAIRDYLEPLEYDPGPVPDQLDAPSILQAPVNPVNAAAQLYPLSKLIPCPWNPRQHIDEKGIDELAASMAEHGFRPYQPIIARLLPDGTAMIAAGHRRRLGAMRAELEYVHAIVVEMTDEVFDEILTFENTSGEAIHPLHEAMGWYGWMERNGKSVADVSARLGIKQGTIYAKFKYCTDLIPEGKEMFLAGRLTEGHAVLIARQTPYSQRMALACCTAPRHDPDRAVPSTRDLAVWIKQNCQLSLSEAPFSPADDTLPIIAKGGLMAALCPQTGSCVECPKRSGFDPGLFPDIPESNVCTDPQCYRERVRTYESRKAAAAPPPAPAPPPVKPKAAPLEEPAPEAEPEPEAAPTAEDLQRRADDLAEEARLRDVEEKRIAREEEVSEKVFDLAVDSILAAVRTPLKEADIQDVLIMLVGLCDYSVKEVADKYDVKQTTSSRAQDLIAAVPRISAHNLRRIMVGLILYETAAVKGPNNAILHGFARRYRVNLPKIRASVVEEIEIREGIRKLTQPVDARKVAIARLPPMQVPTQKKPAPLKKAVVKVPPPKKAAKKPAPKKVAPKGKAKK